MISKLVVSTAKSLNNKSSHRISRIIARQQQRLFASVYTFGQGWTGALGNGRFDRDLLGHDDEEEVDVPSLIYDTTARSAKGFDDKILSAAAGWGHTALVVQEEEEDNDDGTKKRTNKKKPTTTSRVLVCGRPHDFQALLRLRRLPSFMRPYVTQMHSHYINLVDYAVGRGTDAPPPSENNDWAEEEEEDWEEAENLSLQNRLTPMDPLPNDDTPAMVRASAGWTAILGRSGRLYTFGLNGRGQCGVGGLANNVWKPQSVVGLHPLHRPGDGNKKNKKNASANNNNTADNMQHSIQSVALGLQHGYALSDHGHVYAWGKGNRGQLGQENATDQSVHAQRIRKYSHPVGPATEEEGEQNTNNNKKNTKEEKEEEMFELPAVKQISSGHYHGALLTETNEVFVWGKNMRMKQKQEGGKTDNKQQQKNLLVDAPQPTPMVRPPVPPGDRAVLRISCGSHHVAVLYDDGSVYGMGVSTDTKEMMPEPYLLVPPGIIELPVRQFESHFDRTTIVGRSGTQVLQVHLWKDPLSREYGVFTPFWVDGLLQELDGRGIRSVHRGWLHTVVVTD